jgi:hypothetical protein
VFGRHSRENGNPVKWMVFWIPAFAGMTVLGGAAGPITSNFYWRIR